jgi:muconate cycloisomerase
MAHREYLRELQTIILDIPLKRPHVMSFGSITEVNFVLVRLVGSSGLVGYGEAATLQGPTWSEESSESIKATIDRYISPLLKDINLLEYKVVLNRIGSRVKGNAFAKAAVEFALLDLFGKHYQEPIYALLGGRFRDRVPLSWSLASGTLSKDLAEAREMMAKGITIFKAKAGADRLEADIERIRAIRNELGDGISLRVDVNQGWDGHRATRAIFEMEDLRLDFCEQPLPKWDIEGLAELRKRNRTPIMADESLNDMATGLALIKKRAADIFSIKLTKMGGLLGALNFYNLIQAAGLGTYIGCMIETCIGTAAYLQFAAAVPHLEYGCELFGPLLLTSDIGDQPIKYENGSVCIPEGPGLGVHVDEKLIEKYRRKTNHC